MSAASVTQPPVYPKHVYRGRAYHALSETQWEAVTDAALVINETGHIEAFGPWAQIAETLTPKAQQACIQLPESALMLPGLCDLHVHLPQLYAMAKPAANLLDWLEQHIFPAEAAFESDPIAKDASAVFFQGLLQNGTTTAGVYLTSHPQATQIAFQAAHRTGIRTVMGMTLMDRNAPDSLCLDAETALEKTQTLIETWHQTVSDRIHYALIPRFAVSCSTQLLKGIGQCLEANPSVYLMTHLAEQPEELAWVKTLFPQARDYTDVYDHFGLLGPKSLLAHGIHLNDRELNRLTETKSTLIHCPHSNFFLKSGRFPIERVQEHQTPWALGTDVGAGPSLSLFETLKSTQFMQPQHTFSEHTLLYRATLGGAEALGLADRIGNFLPGKAADFIILDFAQAPYTRFQSDAIEERLAALIYTGSQHLVTHTVIQGQAVYAQNRLS